MRILQRLAVVALLVVVPIIPSHGQNTPLTKEQVIQMSKAGVADDVIVARIKAEPSPVNLNTDDLIALKSAGVSDAVVRALVAPAPKADPSAPSPTPAAAPAVTDPNDPRAPHDPGIYLLALGHDGGKKMILIERAGSGHEKTANVWGHAFSYGISKAKIKAEIPGPRAAVRATVSTPEFYMYFPPTGNLGAADMISSPSQFSLLWLEAKKDHRETTVEKVGFASASAGTDEKRVFKINSDKIRPYVYRVVPDQGLRAGEYAFIAATGMGGTAAATSVVVFDFGVDLK
jgi:hypothetical protein